MLKKCHHEILLDLAVNKKLRSSFLRRKGGEKRADSLFVTRKKGTTTEKNNPDSILHLFLKL